MSTVSHENARPTCGRHSSPEGGTCVMELASMPAGEPFSDRPESVCPVAAGRAGRAVTVPPLGGRPAEEAVVAWEAPVR